MTAPQRFRSRPQTVEAVRWLGEENCEEVFAFLGLKHPTHADTNHAWIEGLNGDLRVVGNPGDWIVRHGEDRFEVLTDAEFRAAYDPEMTERQDVAECSATVEPRLHCGCLGACEGGPECLDDEGGPWPQENDA